MALNLRDFLEALGKDLIQIDDEIDPISQAGALCSASPRPVVFNRLKGFPGWKLCDILVKDRARQALALGTTPKNVVRDLSERMFSRVPGQSKLVADGPCKEVKLIGDAADITKLPIPIHSEGDAGRYLGSGLPITNEVPAQAEIVIEGIVPPGVREPEGPFGEFTGYSKGAEGPAPVFEVTAITRRRDAIYRHMQATVFTDHQPLVSVPMEASLYRRLREIHGHSEVHDVYIPPWVTMFTVFVQMTPRWDGQARDILLGVLSSSYLHPKIAIAVDEDVDIYDPREVFWAISTRVNPERDVIVIPHERIHPLDISAPNVDRSEVTVMRVGGKMAIDATRPPLWRKKERAEFERVKPKGAGDPALEALLKRLAAMA